MRDSSAGGAEGGAGFLYAVFERAFTGLAAELREFLMANPAPDIAASASAPCRNLCVVRILAGRCPELYRTLNECRSTIRGYLGFPEPEREVS